MISFGEIKQRFVSLDQKQKIAFLVLSAFVIGSLLFSVFLLQKVEYQVLYSHISEEEAGAVVQRLKDLKIPYKIDKGSIQVPADKVYELRLQLASEGVTMTGGIGFELFDKTSFAMTDFVQKLNYKRALQGELARTIKTLPEIEQVRVHLTIPEKSLFSVPEEQIPKASVMLKLKQGKKLNDNQVQGIINLVANSIEGLDKKNVVVVNQFGQMLTKKTEDGLSLTSAQLEIQRSIEKDLENKVVNLIEPVVGKNKVKAKIAVELDFSKIEKTEEVFNPESKVVRSEQRNVDKSAGGISAGVPGVASNLPVKTINSQSSSVSQVERANEIVNYEISKFVSKIANSPGNIKRLTVVALVDGNYQGSDKNKKYIPRSDEEIKKFEDLVKNAVGFNEERGDSVSVVNMPFNLPEEDLVESKFHFTELLPFVLSFAKYLTPVLLLIILYFFVIRSLLKILMPKQIEEVTKRAEKVEDNVELSKEKIPLDTKGETLMIPQEDTNAFIIEWAKNNPKEVLRFIKKWVNEE